MRVRVTVRVRIRSQEEPAVKLRRVERGYRGHVGHPVKVRLHLVRGRVGVRARARGQGYG